MKSKIVERTDEYMDDLAAIEAHIAKDNPLAAVDMWLHIDDQVAQLSDPNYPRRPGRIAGTMELVAHENHIVVLKETASLVIVMNVIGARQQWP